MKLPPPHPCPPRRACAALSLIEVMIAMAIFFVCIFAILGMVSNTLHNARALQDTEVDAPGALASFLSTSNRLDEGSYSGDFGDLFPDWDYTYDVTVITNNLVRVDLSVVGGKKSTETHLSLFLVVQNQQLGMPGFGVPGRGLPR
jgi:Tfp pilus assembly protein PilV